MTHKIEIAQNTIQFIPNHRSLFLSGLSTYTPVQ